MCEPNEIDPVITQLEQDLQDLGWRPVEMVEPSTGTPFTRWFPPGKPIPSMYLELVAERITEQGCHEDCQFPRRVFAAARRRLCDNRPVGDGPRSGLGQHR